MTTPLTKPRIDSWDAALTEAQRWEAYAQFCRFPWPRVVRWIEQEYGIQAPSRTSLYAWGKRMRSMESARRVEQAVTARAEAATLAGEARQDDADLVEAFKSLAADIALRTGDAEQAGRWARMALDLGAARIKAEELALKARAQETKDEALRLARDKFEAAERRLAAVREALTAPKTADGGLSPETLRKIEQAAGLL